MWEFSIMLESDHAKVAKFLFNSLKKYVEEVGGIITSFEEAGLIHIVIACDNAEKTRLFYYVKSYITEAICSYFKNEFLRKNLKVNLKNKVSITAFEKALQYFDKETDRYLVEKYLNLEKNIFLESFFEFKLKILKSKWLELTKIANENSSYLLTDDTFIELLRFLVDNLEVSFDTLNIISDSDGYQLLDENFKDATTSLKGDAVWLIENVIALSPRKINIYTDTPSEELNLISSIYSSRTNILPKHNAKIVDKGF